MPVGGAGEAGGLGEAVGVGVNGLLVGISSGVGEDGGVGSVLDWIPQPLRVNASRARQRYAIWYLMAVHRSNLQSGGEFLATAEICADQSA